MSNWDGINEFVAVAEVQSFTAASDKLNTSVANISRRVGALEQKLGVKLLVRTTRKVSLTAEGKIYFQHCLPLVEGLQQADEAILQVHTVPKGNIKLTAPVTFGEQILAPIVCQFMEMYPDISLELVLSNKKLDLIEEGIDLAIRIGNLEDSTMIAKKLFERQNYVCCSPDYAIRHEIPLNITDLKHHQCLQGTNKYWKLVDEGSERSIKVDGRFKCNSGNALVEAALQGVGIVQLPDYYVDIYLKSGELIEILPGFKCDKESGWVVYAQNRLLSVKIRLLIDFLASKLKI